MRVLVEFDTPAAALDARRSLTALGYRDIETHAPFPLTDEQAYATHGSLPIAALAGTGGAIALAAAYAVQWYANAYSYPLNIGGRPPHAGPAFIPATFETICLAAALAAFAGFLLMERLPRFWQATFEVEGFEAAVVDRFWLEFDARPANDEQLARDILPLRPLRIVVGEEET